MPLFNNARWPFGLILIVAALFFCTSVNAGDSFTAEPPKEEAFRKELKRDLSTLNITVEATEKDITNNLNRIIPKELYKGYTTTRGVNAVILRNGLIAVHAADNYLYLTVPVTMTVGFGSFETVPIANKLKFKLTARVTPDWKIKAEVFYLGLSEVLAENIGLGFFSVNPRNVVDGITQPVQRVLSDLISTKLNEQFPLKVEVTKVWNSAHKPILIDKNYSAWLNITPQEVLIYPFYAQNGLVRLNVGLKSFAELVVGPEPPARQPLPLPPLKQANGADRTFRITLNAELFYKDLRSIALPLLLNKELGSDGKSIILKDLDLYGNGDRMIIKIEATGSIDGIFFLDCRPVFNPKTNVFSVEDVDFDMQTKSLLLRSADWFLHGSIKSKIQEKLNMDLSQRLVQAREMADKALANLKLADNVYLNGKVKTMKLSDVMGQKDKMLIQIDAEGETSIVFK